MSFDIDANGILQVTAMDRTTGREQSITVQGASTLTDSEIKRMISDAQQYAETDRLKRDKVDKRNKAEALTFQAERQLREATLDFGMQFVSTYRTRIESANRQLREALKQDDDRGVDRAKADLEDALYDLTREVYQRNKEDEEQDSIFGAIKSFFTDDDDDYYYDDRRDFGRSGGYGGYSGGGYGNDRYGSSGDRSNNDRYGNGYNDRASSDRSRTDRPSPDRSSSGYSDRSNSNYSANAPSRSSVPPEPRNDRAGRSNYSGNAPRNDRNPPPPDRNDRPSYDRSDRSDRTDDRRSRPSRNPRPNLAQDNWDDDDDWL